ISGTPGVIGNFAGTFTATNGVTPNATRDFSITIEGAPQRITFTAVPNQTFGARPPTLAATASSGLPITFVVLTPAVCAVSGNTISLVVAGACTVRASQDGNANYSPAPDVDQSITYGPPRQILTFWTPSDHTLGSSPFPLEATASSGLAVSFTSLSPAICTVSSAMVTLVAAGTCLVRASQSGNGTFEAV